MLKYVLIATLALIGTIIAAPQQDKGLDALLDSVFGKPTPAPISDDPDIDKKIHEIFKNNKTNQNNENCECVPYYQCQNKTIVDDGVGIIDIRLRPCEDSLHVCCMPPSIKRGPETVVTLPPFKQRGCGQRNAGGIGFRITGAENGESQFGEFPWMVAILKQEGIGNNGEKMNVYQCGGSLIHPQVVLTGAHCVFEKSTSELKIRAGEWDTQTSHEILPHQDRDVERTIIHENYHKGALRNDYALLILKQPVVLADNVDVVCLPDPGAVFDGSRCFASGWGKDIFGIKGHYQVILKRVELPIVNHNQCQSQLRKTRLGSHFVLHTSFICAGGELGKDTCKGDGGSPLVCPLRNDPSRYVQAGSVAWGIGCGENGVPGVYANIAAGRHWIDDKMNSLGFGTKSYVY